MVPQAKPALQGQTKIRKEVFGLKTAIKWLLFSHTWLSRNLSSKLEIRPRKSYLPRLEKGL